MRNFLTRYGCEPPNFAEEIDNVFPKQPFDHAYFSSSKVKDKVYLQKPTRKNGNILCVAKLLHVTPPAMTRDSFAVRRAIFKSREPLHSDLSGK